MDKYQQDFIRNLKYFRKISGISQAELAEKCEVATGTIGNIECGLAKPSFDLMLQMARILKIRPGDFFISIDQDETSSISTDKILAEYNLLREFYEKLKVYFET